MNCRVFCVSVLVSCLCSTSLSAEPIRINPYPEQTETFAPALEQEVLQTPEVIETEVIVEATLEPVFEESAMDEPFVPAVQASVPPVPVEFAIPQPGDSYFDPPSAIDEVMVVSAEEELEPLAPIETLSPEPMQTQMPEALPVPEPAPQQAENLRVRMSESFDDMVVNQSFSSPPASEPKVASLPPPIVKPKPAPQPEGEKIVWFDERIPPKAPMKMDAPKDPIEVLDDGLVRISMHDAARSDALLAEDAPSGQKWKALEGANIRQVLSQWAQMEGAKLVWEINDAFAVLQSFEVRGPFHSAVKNLLDQYQDNQVRPVATLHVDPQNGQQTLVVRVLDGA